MKSYSTFIFDSYEFNPDTGEIVLRYSLDDEVKFEEKIRLPKLSIINYQLSIIDDALFALHLIGGISYYKTCIPENIEIRSGSLTEDQAEFWNTVYTKGLAEFCYRNEIDPSDLALFPKGQIVESLTSKVEGEDLRPSTFDSYLVPIGGGKDSMVTAELLKTAGIDFAFFRVGQHPIITKLAELAGKPLVNVERTLDPQLFELNKAGALNGHVPITGYISFLSLVVALLEGRKGVVLSNESSANFGNVTHNSQDINHQWSKSLEFERMFQQYVREHITRDCEYFSLLRPFSELAITGMYAKHSEYFSTATSCNRNWKILKDETAPARWCGECPKCAFVFCQLAAFLPASELVKMFGKNLFEDASLLPLYKQLLGLEGIKPFECVGTPDEVAAAFLLALQQEGYTNTVMMDLFLTEKAQQIENPAELVQAALEPSEDHAIPPEFLACI